MSTGPDASKKRIAHIVSHTHWDREWRFPIWETRLMLVDFMDELIDVLERGLYPAFLLDGQVAPVLDYLEVRPEMRPRIETLVREGKLQVGPWYILPDEYPIDGESLVRNLLWGNRMATALGRVFNAGYTPFGWGQTAQLPQIYAGFGMDVAMIGKRVSHERAPHCEFLWRAPDGSELLSTRFGDLGRQNFYFKVHLSALFGVDHEGPDWVYRWGGGDVAWHRADPEQMEQDHAIIGAPTRWFPETITPEMSEAAWNTMHESLLPDDRLMMNGCDYTASQPMFPEMVARLNEVDPDPDRVWVHTSMPAYVQIMRDKIDRAKLRVVEGELRDGPSGPVTGNALATRLYLKRKNKRAQNLLIRHAEPLCVLAALAGAPHPAQLVRSAWEFLLASHPHDSINGVTQDKTADDVSHRLDQVIDLAETLGNRAMQELTRRIDCSGFAGDDVLLIAFNPLPYPRREVLEAWVNTPGQMPVNVHWPLPVSELQVYGADGAPLGTQWEGQSNESYPVCELHTRAFPYNCSRHRLFFDSGEIPAGGYRVYRAGSMDGARDSGVAWKDSLARTSILLAAPNVLENEHLRVTMNPNGTFDLTHKGLGRTFESLNAYEDRGEHGDYWINSRPVHDQVHTSHGCASRIWAEEAGPLRATLVSEVTLRLPRCGYPERQRRGDAMEDLTLRTAVTLKAGEEQVEVRVDFENRIEDHYLRVLFPTGIENTTHADTGGHFTVDRRPIRPQGPTPGSVWPDMATLPANNFIDVSDGETGFAILHDGLTEYEVMDHAGRTVALSLLRAVRNWLCTETRVGSSFPSQKGGQCLGPHRIRYAIRPHTGAWSDANIPLHAERFNVPPALVQTNRHASQVKSALPGGAHALFSLGNANLRFSSLKMAEDRASVILRVYNPTDIPQTGEVRFGAGAVRAAWLTNLNEERLRELPLVDGAIPLEVEPEKIITVEAEFSTLGQETP